jgi:hypothetical protein
MISPASKSKTDSPAARWPQFALIGLFALGLLLPMLDLAFHIDPTAPPSENRLPAPCPPRPRSFADLKKFFADWETYFNDHFGCRKTLVNWHNRLKWQFFQDKNANNVLVGTGGWIYMSEKRMVDHFRGTLQLTEPELQGWQKLLERRRDWLAARGIKYIFVLAPDKHSVYPEFLPAWLKDLGGRTKADQFFDYMKAHSTVEVFDPRPLLRAAKKTAPVYLQTDTHWNQLGAFLACEEVIRRLGQNQLPGLTPISLDAYEYTNRMPLGGDLLSFRGTPLSQTESNAFFFTPKPELPPLETFVPIGAHCMEVATTKNPQGHGLAVVYSDSFGRRWVPFLGYHFGEVEYCWQDRLDGRLLESQKPVVVVNEMVERFFNVTDPKRLSAQDGLP